MYIVNTYQDGGREKRTNVTASVRPNMKRRENALLSRTLVVVSVLRRLFRPLNLLTLAGTIEKRVSHFVAFVIVIATRPTEHSNCVHG